MPSPDPEPPQPIPPEEPIPAPEPPHAAVATAGPAADATSGMSAAADTADSSATAVVSTTGVSTTGVSTTGVSTTANSAAADSAAGDSKAADSSAAADFIDASPPEHDEWPPPGSFDDERPTAPVPVLAAHESTQVIPPASVGWQAPPPTSPWQAQHEAPGQWQTTPPQHLGWQQAPPPPPEPIWSGRQQPKRRRRGAVWVSIALVATVLLCGGGAASAYFLLREADNPGSPDPATAVDRFLTAVYSEQDPSAATDLVCREARNEQKISNRVLEIKTYSQGYQDPIYRWDAPAVSQSQKDRAQVAVHVTMSTADERSAEQDLQFTVIHKTGWLVCDVTG
jgi:hypothetical protein